MRKAFTMVELVFTIVIIGILASIAMPKLTATRNDGKIASEIASLKQQLTNAQSHYLALGSQSAQAGYTSVGSQRAYFHTNCYWIQVAQYSDKKWYLSYAPTDAYHSGRDVNKCDENEDMRNKIYEAAKKAGLCSSTTDWCKNKKLSKRKITI